jgi:hypothetical protein
MTLGQVMRAFTALEARLRLVRGKVAEWSLRAGSHRTPTRAQVDRRYAWLAEEEALKARRVELLAEIKRMNRAEN